MEPCPYRQGEPAGRVLPLAGGRPQWSPALIGRESPRRGLAVGRWLAGRNGALPLSAGRVVVRGRCGDSGGGRNGALPLSAGRELAAAGDLAARDDAAMEPCPYRQGELDGQPPGGDPVRGRRNGALPLSAGRGQRQRSAPARTASPESCRNGALPLSAGRGVDWSREQPHILQPQWSPALIGRESAPSAERVTVMPLAAMEPCPYRQGEIDRNGWRR